jgi:hypothetical protein
LVQDGLRRRELTEFLIKARHDRGAALPAASVAGGVIRR